MRASSEVCKLTILCEYYFRGGRVSPAQYCLICQRLLSADNQFEIKFVYSFSHWVLVVIISEASCVAWCLRWELLFLLFPLAIKAAVTLVNLKIKETETTRKRILKCDVSTLYVLFRPSPAATRHQNDCQVSLKLSVTYLFTNIRFDTLLSQKSHVKILIKYFLSNLGKFKS